MIKKPLIIPFLITLIFSTFSPIAIHTANAATVGTAPCDSTVSSATGVTATVSGDYCVVSFTDTTTAVTWTVPTGVSSVRTLVVGGGGGTGGGGTGGGGGYTVPSMPYNTTGSRFSLGFNEAAIDSKHIVHLSLTEGLDRFWPFGQSILENIAFIEVKRKSQTKMVFFSSLSNLL